MNNQNEKIETELTSKTTEKKPTHLWRCMNCYEMTYEYICTHCGKPSYNKTADENLRKRVTAAENTDRHEERTKATKEKNAETALTKELKSFADRINKNIKDAEKIQKYALSAVSVLLVVLSIVFAVKLSKSESKISDLTEANKTLSESVKSQLQETAELKKTIEQSTEKTVEQDTDNQVKYIVHTVEDGENLVSICDKYNIDYNACESIIFAANGIDNPNYINPGQKIILPQFGTTTE